MPQIKCRIIPEPQEGTRPILKNDNKSEPFIIGNGDLDYVCGKCNNVIAENVFQGETSTDTTFECPYCKEFNEVYNV
jgi:DNA-directed RNA polymerase subunit RPC12/RpoP